MRNAVFLSVRCSLLVVAVAILTTTWAAEFDRSQPTKPERILAGTVAPGQMLRAGTTVRNPGDSRLIISTRSAKCCGGDLANTWIVPPHEARFVTGKVGAPTNSGPFLRRVEFESSDPANPTVAIEVVGIVDPNAQPQHAGQ
jgi:hypothetical protein